MPFSTFTNWEVVNKMYGKVSIHSLKFCKNCTNDSKFTGNTKQVRISKSLELESNSTCGGWVTFSKLPYGKCI